jgi:hypothetical protein
MAVDWEQRIDFDRLRAHRLARTTAGSDLGGLLRFDHNLRSVRGADFVDGKLVRDELVV